MSGFSRTNGRDHWEFGPFRVDAVKRLLLRGGEGVSLPGRAFDVLLVLLQKPGITVSKEELMKAVWPDTFVEEGNLTQTVFVLRKALGDSDGQPLIVTVPRQGYRFVGRVSAPSGDEPTPGRKIAAMPWRTIAAMALVLACGWWIVRWRAPSLHAESGAMRLTVLAPPNTTFREGRISPDGQWLAFIGVETSGRKQLWVRRLDSLTAQPLTRAESPPIWSPDSRSIAFGNDGRLNRVEVAGGAVQSICETPLVLGGSWSRDGTILFSSSAGLPRIYSVAAKGGKPRAATTTDPQLGDMQHTFPVFLPDGKHFLYTVQSREAKNGGVYAGSLDSASFRARILEDVSNVEFAPAGLEGRSSGHLLFVRGRVLMAQSFDAESLQLRGEAIAVEKLDNPRRVIPGGSFSASSNGMLLISPPVFGSRLIWRDRTGTPLRSVGDGVMCFYPQISPDEQTVAADAFDAVTFTPHVWLYPLSGTRQGSKFTFMPTMRPLWSPDGRKLAFEALDSTLYTKTIDGNETERLLLKAAKLADDQRLPCDWSRDGHFLLYAEESAKSGFDLWKVAVSGTDRPVGVVTGPKNETCGAFSPDGHRITMRRTIPVEVRSTCRRFRWMES